MTDQLPSRREVIQILEDLFDLLYPGFGRKQNLHQENVVYHVGDLVDGLYERLRVQICRAMNRRECEETRNEGAPARSSDAKTSLGAERERSNRMELSAISFQPSAFSSGDDRVAKTYLLTGDGSGSDDRSRLSAYR